MRYPLPYAFARTARLLLEDDGQALTLWHDGRPDAGHLSEVMRRFGAARVLLAGTAQGLFRGEPAELTFTRIEGRRFTDRLPLPPGWLPCAGAHRMQFGAEAPGGPDATG